MKKLYVETSNWKMLKQAVAAIENAGSEEAKIMLLNSEPGAGKTAAVNKFGADNNALLIEGMPDMKVSFITEYIANRLGIKEHTNFAKYDAIINRLSEYKTPIILDECQYAAEGKGAPIDYLRRISEQASVMLILVCHTSERSRFTAAKMAHIHSRISANPIFQPASIEDCKLYLTTRCEVELDDGVIELVHKQSRGIYRLINNAIKTLEAYGKSTDQLLITASKVGKMLLCEDVARGI